MRNIVIWGFETGISCHAFKKLEEQGLISIKAWFGDRKDSEVVTHNWFEIVFEEIKTAKLLYCEEAIYNKVYDKLYVFMDTLARQFYFQNKTIHEYLNVFNYLLNYFYTMLKKNKVDVIVYHDIPHGAPDYLLYCLAKAMGIETFIVSQSLFPDRFFYVHDIADFGDFKQVSAYQAFNDTIEVKKEYEKELFYMKEASTAEQLQGKLKILNFSKWKQERIQVWKNSLRKYDGINDFISQRVTNKLVDYHKENEYKKMSSKCFSSVVNLTAKFVYFPLHLQPEMTTSILGGIYCDQLLAIERLAKWIPDDWVIYVKENPKQTSYMRGKQFFDRLQMIPKVQGVSKKFNTYDLIKNSQFIATITGTAGWEAISGGKNAVVFGKAWYSNLPGAFSYDENLDLQAVVEYQINHKELEEQLAELLKKTGQGLVIRDYISLVPEYNQEDNNRKTYAFFKQVFQELDEKSKEV